MVLTPSERRRMKDIILNRKNVHHSDGEREALLEALLNLVALVNQREKVLLYSELQLVRQ